MITENIFLTHFILIIPIVSEPRSGRTGWSGAYKDFTLLYFTLSISKIHILSVHPFLTPLGRRVNEDRKYDRKSIISHLFPMLSWIKGWRIECWKILNWNNRWKKYIIILSLQVSFVFIFISTDLYLQDYHFILTVLFTFVGPRDKKWVKQRWTDNKEKGTDKWRINNFLTLI